MASESLGMVCDIVMGQSPPGESCNTLGEGLPLLNGPTEFGGRHPTPVQYTTDVRKRARAGDLLFCVRGSTTGRMNWADQEYAIGRGIAAIRHKTLPALQPLVRAAIEGSLRGLLAQATGSTFPNVSAGQLAHLPWPTLPTAQQRAIAHILGALDDKIELNRKMSGTLEEMVRVLFKSWFVDFDPVRAKAEGRETRLPKNVARVIPNAFEKSVLGEIPRGWVVKTLGAFVTSTKGRSYRSDELAASDVALVTLKSFARGGGYRPDGLKEFTGAYNPEQVIQHGDILIACTDVTQAAEIIGRPAMVRGLPTYNKLVASLDTVIVRPIAAPFTVAFLYFLARTDAFTAHSYAYTTGTTVLHLAKEAIPSFQFCLPPTPLVQHFDAFASPILARIDVIAQEMEILTVVRDELLPRLLSGELRVKDAERFVQEAV